MSMPSSRSSSSLLEGCDIHSGRKFRDDPTSRGLVECASFMLARIITS